MLKFIKLIFNIVLYLVTFPFPRSNKIIIVGGWDGKRFADNSKGLFLYLNQNKSVLNLKKIFWYTNDPEIRKQIEQLGYDVLFGINFKSIFWHLRSAVHFIDQNPHDILGFLSVHAKRINLWHGVPLKNIGIDLIDDYTSGNPFFQKWSSGGLWIDQYILATSDFASDLLTHAMDLPKSKSLIASYPRNIELYQNYPREINNNDVLHVYYLPTYRYGDEINPILKEDLKEINQKLVDNNVIFHIKPHFASLSEWEIIDNFSNFIIIDAKEDVYESLLTTDLLVTDYSSVFFDFLLTNKPVLFFPYDLEKYENQERGFTMSFEEHTPGDKVFNTSDLINKILSIKNDYSKYINDNKRQYTLINKKMNRYTDSIDFTEILNFMK
ncbi:CDP-glycerol glycerophosphotransferase family protein [Streptococcus parauberis]|uniref:CDP-glycerol glycerophosphotransferase family protein n=1 Tax=Streptococcus parauberis TaxID=1348 RepID=A0AAE4L129_9STRE|nr:CDP-glycerol glycerophosphotransferase family protein [Streptococcus parauberis]MDT2732479.1 CDP-glycerol glycerophosphotransferase family protein [Streptococcus parauberis]